MKTDRIAVTGASGTVGRQVATLLAGQGIACIPVNRSDWDLAEWHEANELDAIFGDVDAIIHCAALVPRPNEIPQERVVFDCNVRACLNLGAWAVNSQTPLVHVSGATVYADVTRPGIREDDAKTTRNFAGFYGFSKYLGELVLDHLVGRGLRVCILRPSSIYGAGMAAERMIPRFLKAAQRDETIPLYSPVDDRINLVHASDVATAALAALRGEAWGIFNIAGPASCSIREIAQACVTAAGRGAVIVNGAEADRVAIQRFELDNSKATAAFDYRPSVNLEAGLRLMLAEETF